MSGHTKGPWKWWTSNSFLRLSGPDGKDGGVLCPTVSRSDGHPDLIVRKADMALIEAAPDLLESLEDMVSLVKSRCYPQPDKPSSDWGRAEAAELIIKKAKGES